MQSTSNAYKQYILSPNRKFDVRVTIDTVVLTNEQVISFTITTPQADDGLTIGRTISTSIELLLLNDGLTLFSTNKVKVEIGLYTGTTYEYVLMGFFNVDEVTKSDYSTKVTGFDNMVKFELPYFPDEGVEAIAISSLIDKIETITGIAFEGTLVPDYTVSNIEGFTCREIFGYIAGLYGGNGYISRNGNFKVVTPIDVSYTISGDNYFLPFKKEEIPYTIGKVTSVWENKEFTKGTSTGTSMMELEFENPWVTQTILDSLYAQLYNFSFLGYNLKWQGDMSIDVGDIITCNEPSGSTTKLFIPNQKITYNGGIKSEISAKGQTKSSNSFKTTSDVANKVKRVVAEQMLIKEALINVAHIDDLTATNITFEIASGTTLSLQNLLSQFVTGNAGQFIHLTTLNTSIENAVIKSAMIESLAVDKIAAGDISTTKFRIKSDSGKMLISDNTIQISDATRVRVQIGKDASNDYNMYVWDASGKLMFDATGLKADGIKAKIIRDDMVSDTANISGSKLNIASVVTSINNGATQLKSSTIVMDGTTQTLSVAFNSLTTTVNGIDVGTRNMLIKSNSGFISPWGSWEVGQVFVTEEIINNTVAKIIEMRPKAAGTANAIHRVQTGFEIGKQYTFSFLCRIHPDETVESGIIKPFINTYGSVPITKTWTKIVHTQVSSAMSNTLHISTGGVYKVQLALFKLECGNKATDWMPAIEDVDGKIDANTTLISVVQGKITTLIENTTIVNEGQTIQLKDAYNQTVLDLEGVETTVGNLSTTITSLGQTVSSHTSTIEQHTADIALKVSASEVQETITQSVDAAIAVSVDGILLKVSDSYISKDDEQGLIDKATSSAISQTSSAITIEFNKASTSIQDVADSLQTEIDERKSYIRFEDGTINLGVIGSEFTASLDNDSLDFKQGLDIVAQITNKKMLITDAEIKNKLTLGQPDRGYFDFVPRANGNLSLKWRAS